MISGPGFGRQLSSVKANYVPSSGGSPDVSGDGFVTCSLPVKVENTNCRLALAEAACHILKGE